MFSCPGCLIPLHRLREKSGVYYACNRCGGRGITTPFLRRATDRLTFRKLWQHVEQRPGAGKPCPICSRATGVVELGPWYELVEIDICKRCQFLWFDAEEFQLLPPRPEPDILPEERPIQSQAAREALAMAEIKRIQARADAENDQYTPPDDWLKVIVAVLGLPVEDHGRTLEEKPLATWTIGAVMVVVSVMAFADLDTAVTNLGLIPAEPWRLWGATFLTSFLLHGGLLHLLSNLYFLLIFGDDVEDFVGKLGYVVLIALASLGGDALHIAFDPRNQVPLIGASAGISGLLAYYMFRFPTARLIIMPRLGWIFPWFLRVPAWLVFGFWLAIQCVGALIQLDGFSDVSYLGHLGGFGVGFLFWLLWRFV